jgi:hypothetical protein
MEHLPEWVPLIISMFNLTTAAIKLAAACVRRCRPHCADPIDPTAKPQPEPRARPDGR